MYKKILSDFSAGVNYACAPLQLGLDSKVTPWANGLNVEIYCTKGVCRQNGNVLIGLTPEPKAINSIFTFTPSRNPKAVKILYSTADGEFYEYDRLSGEHVLRVVDLRPDTPCVYAEFMGGVAICNGKDTPFYYKGDEDGGLGSFFEMNTVGKDGESPILATAVCAYKSRLWLADEDTLYYSALGRFDDWTSTDDAGFISNFHCDSAPVTALRPYKDYIAIYKRTQTYLLSGSTPDEFAIAPFADKGACAQNAVVTASNKQYFFSGALFSLEQSGLLSQIALGSEASLPIKPILNGDSSNIKTLKDQFGNSFRVGCPLDKSNLQKAHLLYYEPKNQLWLYIPTQNNPYLNNIWIYDITHDAWTHRGQPQPILCASNYGEQIISATDDGRIYLEDVGSTFDDEPITFEWKSPFLALGNVNSRKSIDDFYFLFSDLCDNKFRFCTFKDYDSLDAQDLEVVNVSNSLNMIWADEASEGGQFDWAGDSDDFPSSKGKYWAVPSEIAEKIDISLSCTALQLCIFGDSAEENFAMLALEFKEIFEE